MGTLGKYWFGLVVLASSAIAVVLVGTIWFLITSRASAPGGVTGIEIAVADGQTLVDLREVARETAWETMYVFWPYDSEAEVDRVLGWHWPHSGELALDASESFTWLVLVKGRDVVGLARLPRNLLEIDLGGGHGPIARNDAVFTVTEGKRGWRLLTWQKNAKFTKK